MRRPNGITGIAALFFAAGVCLCLLGITRLISPNVVSLMAARRFMFGLELAGPYMILLAGSGYALVGWGLFRTQNWARWVAMLVMVVGVTALVPAISMAELGLPILWYGLQIALRVAVGWYLAQAPAVVDAFVKKA